jgi:phage antirepressor YoqD-like protein
MIPLPDMNAQQQTVSPQRPNSSVIVYGVALAPVDYHGARVMTLSMMDAAHKRPDGTARRNFNENKTRLIEGEDFFKVSADEIRTHKICAISSKAHEDMVLLTETGYSMVVKSFTDDLAWDVQRQLVRSYFRSAGGAVEMPNFDDPIAMARAWADAKESERAQAARAAQLEHRVEEQAEAVAGFNRIANADGAMCITDAAKSLQVQPHKLRDVLLEMKWMYRRQGKAGYVAYQDRIHAGHLKHKVGNYTDPETGENKTNPQVLVTSKGLAQLSKLLGPPEAPPSKPVRAPSRLN